MLPRPDDIVGAFRIGPSASGRVGPAIPSAPPFRANAMDTTPAPLRMPRSSNQSASPPKVRHRQTVIFDVSDTSRVTTTLHAARLTLRGRIRRTCVARCNETHHHATFCDGRDARIRAYCPAPGDRVRSALRRTMPDRLARTIAPNCGRPPRPCRTYVVFGYEIGFDTRRPVVGLGTVRAPDLATARRLGDALARDRGVPPSPLSAVRTWRAGACRPAWLWTALARDGADRLARERAEGQP